MNVVDLPIPDKTLAALEEIKRNLNTICESQIVLAQVRKAKYDALLKVGFTEQQALDLCKDLT